MKNDILDQGKREENSWEELFNRAIVGIYRSTEEGKFLLVNQAFARIFGYDSAEHLMKSVPNFTNLYVNPEDRQDVLNKIKKDGLLDSCEILAKTADESHIWVSLSAREIGGNLQGESIFEGFVTDISQRKIAEASLLENEKRFRTLVEQAGDSFIMHDFKGKIFDVNQQTCIRLGYTKAELLKLSISDIVESVRKQQYWEPLAPGQYVTFESIHKHKNGAKIPVEARLSRVDYDDKRFLLSLVRDITHRKRAEAEQKKHLQEIKTLKNRLEEENIYLREEVEIRYRHEEIIGESIAIKKALSDAEKVAKEDTCVLILGETGTGKELMARAIHNMSPRRGHSMIKVNCAALPSSLIESELFGREKGAFTGAISKQIGRFEAANGSTLFLDEIGDLPQELQAKLLRVLQDGSLERLGSPNTIKVDVRVIAATNHDLEALTEEKKFRQDLFYRLNVFPVKMPSLHDRREDIPLLVWSFVKEFSQKMGKPIKRIPKKAMEEMENYHWPGNIRELKNFIERAMILNSSSTLKIDRLETDSIPEAQVTTLYDLEKKHIIDSLEKTGWRISGKKGAAILLGLNESTLRSRMKRMGIEKPWATRDSK